MASSDSPGRVANRAPDPAAALAAAAPDGSHQVVVAPDRERLVESIVAPVAESA